MLNQSFRRKKTRTHQIEQFQKRLRSNFLQRACVGDLELGGVPVHALRAEVRGALVG